MKKYLITIHATAKLQKSMKDTPPEERKKSMEAWFAWKDSCGDSLVDFGQPVGPSVCLTQSGESPSKMGLIGYHILQAQDMQAAKKLLENHQQHRE